MNTIQETWDDAIEQSDTLHRLRTRFGGTDEEITAFLDAWPMHPQRTMSWLLNESELYFAAMYGETIDWSHRDPNWRMP